MKKNGYQFMMESYHLTIHNMMTIISGFFNTREEAKQFFTYLNSSHPNIKFTIETEVSKVITFLDVLSLTTVKLF